MIKGVEEQQMNYEVKHNMKSLNAQIHMSNNSFNLDDMTYDELILYIRNNSGLVSDPGHALLLDYANWRVSAITARNRGHLQTAWYHEEICDNIYDQLPEELKW